MVFPDLIYDVLVECKINLMEMNKILVQNLIFDREHPYSNFIFNSTYHKSFAHKYDQLTIKLSLTIKSINSLINSHDPTKQQKISNHNSNNILLSEPVTNTWTISINPNHFDNYHFPLESKECNINWRGVLHQRQKNEPADGKCKLVVSLYASIPNHIYMFTMNCTIHFVEINKMETQTSIIMNENRSMFQFRGYADANWKDIMKYNTITIKISIAILNIFPKINMNEIVRAQETWVAQVQKKHPFKVRMKDYNDRRRYSVSCNGEHDFELNGLKWNIYVMCQRKTKLTSLTLTSLSVSSDGIYAISAKCKISCAKFNISEEATCNWRAGAEVLNNEKEFWFFEQVAENQIFTVNIDILLLRVETIGGKILKSLNEIESFVYNNSLNCLNNLIRVKGVCKRWNKKGFGFISIDGGDDVFVHGSEIQSKGYKSLSVGQTVEFNIVLDEYVEKRRAVNVIVRKHYKKDKNSVWEY